MDESGELRELLFRLDGYVQEIEQTSPYKTIDLGEKKYSLPLHNLEMVKKMIVRGLTSGQFDLGYLLDYISDEDNLAVRGHIIDAIGMILGDPDELRGQRIKQGSSRDQALVDEMHRVSLISALINFYVRAVPRYQSSIEEFIEKGKALEGTPFASELYMRNKILPRITEYSPEIFKEVTGHEIPRILAPLWRKTSHLFHLLDFTKNALLRLHECLVLLFPERVKIFMEILDDKDSDFLLRQVVARVLGNTADKTFLPAMEIIRGRESDETLKRVIAEAIKNIRRRHSFFYRFFTAR